MAAVVEHPNAKAIARMRALERHLGRLGQYCRKHAGLQEQAPALEAGSRRLQLETWVRERILRTAEDHNEEGALLSQGVALLMKIGEDNDAIQRAGTDNRAKLYEAQAELMLDAAIGMALSRELQRCIDGAIGGGEVELAKRLSRFHHQLRRGVAAVRERIADSEHLRVEDLSDALTNEPREVRTADLSMDELARQTAADVDRQNLERRRRLIALRHLSRLPARTDILMILLAVLVVLWVGTVKLPALVSKRPPRSIALTELHSPAIVRAEARPPSLFLEVDTAQWQRYTDKERRSMLDRVSVILLTNDYSGALFTDSAGRPVARWLVGRGAELIPDGEPTPEASGATRLPMAAFLEPAKMDGNSAAEDPAFTVRPENDEDETPPPVDAPWEQDSPVTEGSEIR